MDSEIIEIPFGAKDSELKGWEYTIPEDMEAEIKDGKVIIRKKESEDERIRKELIGYAELKLIYFTEANSQNDIDKKNQKWWRDVLAYLERQKEQRPLTTEETELNSIAFLEQLGYTCIPSEKDEYESFEYGNATGWRRKEQKPVERGCPLTDEQLMATDFWEAYLKESIIPGNKPTKQDIDFLLPTARKYFSLIMKEACNICKEWSRGYQKGLKIIKQQLAEWGEEDEKKITFLERLIRYNVPEGQYGWTDGHKGGFVTKLEAISILKSLHPQSHWKPSEEQMKALKDAFRKDGGNEYRKVINSLYRDLEKLL